MESPPSHAREVENGSRLSLCELWRRRRDIDHIGARPRLRRRLGPRDPSTEMALWVTGPDTVIDSFSSSTEQ
jgi:hypothetical protein